MPRNLVFGLSLLLGLVLVVAVTALRAPDPVGVYLVQLTLLVIAIGVLGGAVLDGLIERKRSRATVLAGWLLFLVLFLAGSIVLYPLVFYAPPMTDWQTLLSRMIIPVGAMGAGHIGRSLTA